ncbi:hypothetical protein [Mycobacterium sp. IDR2000157661]|nr:hypothetical protein [Mycobacterium sp. IDR2000157661]ULE33617.1 hypothetical protein K3G64_02595 [Mycobacterium sp. IDR2000157661]
MADQELVRGFYTEAGVGGFSHVDRHNCFARITPKGLGDPTPKRPRW